MATDTRQRLTRRQENLHLLWDRTLEPLARVEIGETIEVETAHNMALFHGVVTEQDRFDTFPLAMGNPLTGPIAVDGALPGDTLVVEIGAIEVADRGHIALVPNTGLLRNHTRPPQTKVWRIVDGESIFNDEIRFPIRPVVGTFGTMPAEDGLMTILPGRHGGNLDDPNLTTGAFYYLPVFVDDALVMVGDLHANQGDSEVAMGIEVDGRVTLRFADLRRGESIPYARIETRDRWIFPADAPTLEEAIVDSGVFAARFLVERLGITMEDAAYVLSAVGDIRISQAAFANYNVTVRTEIPKSIDRRGRLRGYAG